jgi:uncharacterized protein (TIGR00290 family)
MAKMTKQTNHATRIPVLVSWSSGKDSAWALHTLREQPTHYDVRGIFTTVTKTFDRVSIHSTPAWVLKQQAEKLGLPLYEIPIPYPCSNAQYEAAMRAFLAQVEGLPERLTASHFAFGDLFLEDIRQYREDKLSGTGFTPIFPVWGQDTNTLAQQMIASGVRAIITALNPTKVPAEFAGRWFDAELLAGLPDGVDPLGENGEFHTCVIDGPMFSSPINAQPGRIVHREIVSASDDSDDKVHARNTSPTYVYADVEAVT